MQKSKVMVQKAAKNNFWVVIPFYNEEKLIKDTLDALRSQTDNQFTLVCVNNTSTDNSPKIVTDYIKQYPNFSLQMIDEDQKGSGAAADTGARYAIKHGAKIVARTDADSLPIPQWVELLKQDFKEGKRIVGGRLKPRTDEPECRWYDNLAGTLLLRAAEHAPRFLYRQPGQRYPMFMIAGLNMAIDAALYQEVGGFPRTKIEESDDDIALHLKVCQIIPGNKAKLNKKALVYSSTRRARSMGYFRTLLWYWDRKYIPEEADVR